MAVYSVDGVSEDIALARYLWNISICESLYAPLQMFEIGLRNSVDRAMLNITGQIKWFDQIQLTTWGFDQVGHAKSKISRSGHTVTSGRVVAELNLGFWTSMFESHYERADAFFLPRGIRETFPNLPKSRHNRKAIKSKLESVRKLRNRVFHHERIIHWNNLAQQHVDLIEMIGWMSTDLVHITGMIDSFETVHVSGIQPYIEKLSTEGYT